MSTTAKKEFKLISTRATFMINEEIAPTMSPIDTETSISVLNASFSNNVTKTCIFLLFNIRFNRVKF